MHTFGKQQAWQSGRYPIHASPPRGTHFRNLPPPIGKARFRPDIKDAVAAPVYAAMVKSKKVIFHLTGDMGGIAYAVPRELVASVMESDFKSVVSGGQLPAFLYITGDCVYFTGQVSEYYRQFYQPYEFYRAPIFAVPGKGRLKFEVRHRTPCKVSVKCNLTTRTSRHLIACRSKVCWRPSSVAGRSPGS